MPTGQLTAANSAAPCIHSINPSTGEKILNLKDQLIVGDEHGVIIIDGGLKDVTELPALLLRPSSEATAGTEIAPFPLVRFTLGHSPGIPVTKHHKWNESATGVISTTMAFPVTAKLTVVECRLDDMAGLVNARPDCFVILGTPKGLGAGDQAQMVRARSDHQGTGEIPRTKDCFDPSSLLMFDIDIKDENCLPPMQSVSPERAIELLEEALGISLDGVAMLIKPSASAGLFDEVNGRALKNSSGFHIYMAIAGATPEKIQKFLFERLICLGHGHVYVSESGSALIRTVFDASVGQSNRIDFFADPICEEGIARKAENEYRPGGIFDFGKVNLGANEGAFKEIVQQLRAQPEVLDLQRERNQAWIQKKAAEYEESMSCEEAYTKAANLGGRILTGGAIDLYPKDLMVYRFDNGEILTHQQLMDQREKFDGQSLSDPFDEDHVRCKAIFYANLDNGKPFVSSFAHGGAGYFLHDRDVDLSFFPDEDDRNCFRVYDESCGYPGRLINPPGVYEHKLEMRGRGRDREAVPIDIHICDPLHVTAGTCDERGNSHGLVLEFHDIQGRSHRWAMPREMLGDGGDGLNRVLADAGLAVTHDVRNRVLAYLADQRPERHLTSVGTTGWVSLPGESIAFVTPERVIGSERLIFQSPTYHHEGMPSVGGTLEEWQDNVGHLALRNPVLIMSICVALAGPLIRNLGSAESGGLHLQGPSSIGKSTCLAAAVSVWGARDFLRQWRATSNGLEAIAAMLTDTCLILDEINEVEPKHLGQSIYMLANGRGKTRAKQDSTAKQVKSWRLSYLSSGEKTPADYMRMDNARIQAGQEMRLLNVPINRKYGAFDDLHSMKSGAELSDLIKTSSAKHYGHAGMAFIEQLINFLSEQPTRILDKRLEEITANIFAPNRTDDAQAGRAAKKFALFALAGELASEWDIVPWAQGEATAAAKECFALWRKDFGEGPSESRKILEAVRDFIDLHGHNRFVHLSLSMDEKTASDQRGGYLRSGWIERGPDGQYIYLFSSDGLQEATKGFNIGQVTKALDEAGWLYRKGNDGKPSVSKYIDGGTRRVYFVLPQLDF